MAKMYRQADRETETGRQACRDRETEAASEVYSSCLSVFSIRAYLPTGISTFGIFAVLWQIYQDNIFFFFFFLMSRPFACLERQRY